MSNQKFKIQLMDPKPLTWWKTRRTKIDMSPPYQRRGRIWSETDKAYLVDSILNGYDVPKLYMADFTWGESDLNPNRLPYAIIDGKQRFEAIFDFFDGLIVLNDDFKYLPDLTLNLGGLGYRDLQSSYPEVAEAFETYPLHIMSVVANNDDPINELFVRLNRSKTLTGAEIRNAMIGHVPRIIREIANHDFFQTSIAFSVKRGADLNAAAKILIFEFMGKPAETKKKNMDNFTSQADSDRLRLELALRRAIEVLDHMAQIFLPKDKLLANGGILPVYYWFVRETPEERHHMIREFLINFEHNRAENRTIENNFTNGNFVEFDNLNRSTNDLRSHIRRIQILSNMFADWLPTGRS